MNIRSINQRLKPAERAVLRVLASKVVDRERADSDRILETLQTMARGEKISSVSNTYASVWLLAAMFAEDERRLLMLAKR